MSVQITVAWRSSVGAVCLSDVVTAGTTDPDAVDNAASVCIGKR